MLAVAKGDLAAFDEIVLRHQKLAWGIAYRFLGDRHEAEDVAQEAFLRILDAADRYKSTAAFPTYLSRIVIRLCLDQARKNRPVPTDNLPAVLDGNPSAADQVARQDRDQTICAALAGTPGIASQRSMTPVQARGASRSRPLRSRPALPSRVRISRHRATGRASTAASVSTSMAMKGLTTPSSPIGCDSTAASCAS